MHSGFRAEFGCRNIEEFEYDALRFGDGIPEGLDVAVRIEQAVAAKIGEEWDL